MVYMKSVAAAIFVKTPGISSVKTRLAAGIGKEAAEAFHLLSATIVEEVVRNTQLFYPNLKPYWCVAEVEGLTYQAWQSFDRLLQVRGGLGERMADVYNKLLEKNDAVILLGADCPGISAAILSDVLNTLSSDRSDNFIAGPAADGGFYLFAGKKTISQDLWCSVPYSDGQTLRNLTRALLPLGSVNFLPELGDVDSVEDLKSFLEKYKNKKDLLDSQKALVRWAESAVP